MAATSARHLLALVHAPEHVCCRYRLRAFAPHLALAGWKLQPLAVARGPWGFFHELRQAAAAEAVVLQRKLLPRWQLGLLRRVAKVLIYDFDDAVFLRDSNAGRGTNSLWRSGRFAATIRAADVVLAGNRFLAEQASAWTDADRVHYIPTCIDPELYTLALHDRRGSAVRLAWIGSRSTVSSLDMAQPSLLAAVRRLPGLRLKVICDRFPVLPGIEVVPRHWSSQTEAQELADADIGISWLPDHPWSLGKCGLKVLQYMAAGLPVVANPVGIHRQLISHGQTGFLANSPEDWAEAIHRLANSPELRTRMGRCARQAVRAHYDLAHGSQQWTSLLDRLAPAPWIATDANHRVRVAGCLAVPQDHAATPILP
jgi:glycosyltransferase involved in cell wall biosynthesis